MSLTPYVIEDTGRGERSMDIFSRLLKDRIIFIGTGIDDQVANVVIAQLLFLKMEDPKKDINIYINSQGGHITAGLAILDTIEFLGCVINTYCIGQAVSIAALLLASGTKGKRHALPNSRIMLHQPYGGVGGTAEDISIQAKEILVQKEVTAKILSKKTGQPLEQVIKDSDRDFYMSADDAIKYGIVDKIAQPPKKQ
ncbi:MAG: ATP-dependent Clp protease proteolytic subunit [Candidatus Anoxychlamydiales bacterium]|nr:ATP-dependent Clp protease proteolytic subunit [Candidatus Anoxychlamydiales bacterium]